MPARGEVLRRGPTADGPTGRRVVGEGVGTATAKRGQVTAGEASRRIVEKLIHVAVKNLARATPMKRSGYLGSLGWTIGDLYRRLDPAASDELIGDRVTATMMLIHAKEEAARAAWASDGGRA